MDLDEEADVRPLARVGTTIGGVWRIEDLLGIGGAATVYAAVHVSGRRAALKIMHHRLRDDRELRVSFLREADIARTIDHPARVEVHGIGATDRGTPFLIMQLLEGCTLEAVLARTGRLEPAPALAIAAEVLSFLTSCHAHAIVHRDIKPSNVFITVDGHVRMLDLGVALVARRQKTGRRLAFGTPIYMAPEQARGASDLDARADVFAVGALLFHVLTGVQPRHARTTRETLRAAAVEPLRPVGLLAPELPNELTTLIDTATAFDRDARWSTAEAMRVAALGCLARLTREPAALAALVRATVNGEDPSPQRPTLPDGPRSRDGGRPALQQIATAG